MGGRRGGLKQVKIDMDDTKAVTHILKQIHRNWTAHNKSKENLDELAALITRIDVKTYEAVENEAT